MAWQASGAWKKAVAKDSAQDDSSFPGLKPTTPDATAKIEYEELQQNELLALAAIYGDDFVMHTGMHSAWKKTEPTFDIRIKASTDIDFAVTVGFVMTATYPKTPPLLTVKDVDGLREATQFKIQKFVDTEPKEFAKEPQEMVDRIVEGIRDILEDAAQVKASGKQLPSLEEEREQHEAKIALLAQKQKEEKDRKKLEEAKEEERVMSEMLKQQIDRQRQKAKESRSSRRPNGLQGQPSETAATDNEQIDFDQLCHMTDKEGNVLAFRSVASKCDPREGKVTIVYSVRPVLGNGQGTQMLALKEAALRAGNKDPKEFKKQLQSLESRLQDLKTAKRVHHRHLVDVLDFKVESGTPADAMAVNAWTVRILMPMAEKGSLEELLELAGHIEIGKIRSWTRDLLDALNFLHNQNIAHQDIHPGNVLLFREPTGEIVPKISDAWYQREIHNASSPKSGLPGLSSAKSAYWLPPEIAAQSKPQYTYKTDIWEFGIVFVQMIFGLDVLQKYSSPRNLMESLTLSQSLQELVGRFFKDDKQKRPRPFELGSSEFLATDAPVFHDDSSTILSTTPSLTSLHAPLTKLRRDSMTRGAVVSRYTEDFVEEGRLGKGGFGEVVKARKKLDGQIYAIKKITQRSHASLTEILKEVRLLSQLSHPAVVRYYNTWVEEVADVTDTEGETSTDGFTEETRETGSAGIDIQFATSTGGLDFMSSNAAIEFGYDDDSDEADTYEDSDDDSSSIDEAVANRAFSPEKERQTFIIKRARFQRPYRTILYISMEYCEKRTLRDLISRGLCKNTPDIWRLFRQILEGLAHIHGLSIVHRDLKPENIFISSSIDGVDNVKIGDFGLATSGQFSVDKAATNSLETDDMTRSIGTAYYSAPEVRSAANGMYSTKVDMYSLGIIFFEMCYLPMVGMQKADVIGQLRRPKPVLPSDFKPAERTQTEIVLSLVDHNPKERPSSADLLKSGKLPVQMESETIRRTLAGLADPSSPFYGKMLSTLFARPVDAAKDYAWDMFASNPNSAELLNQGVVKNMLISIFRHHGALEMPRSPIYPRSSHYGDNVVQLLDPNGTVLQLPYDLTMGNARMIAKQSTGSTLQRTFSFSRVYRDKQDTGQPNMFGEVDFDIVTTDTLDLALKEAEVLKVLDEIIHTFPSLSQSQMCFHVGHSDLLQLIFEHCGVENACRRLAADALSKLNIHNHTWQKVRMELRSPAVSVSATSVDELQKFDFRDTPNKAFSRLKTLFEGGDMYQRASSTMAHLKEVAEYAKRYGVATKIYINPLNSIKESFYAGGILFSCVYDKKVKDVFAAGGRYDHLIKEQRLKTGGNYEERHAVGFSLAWERLARIPKAGAKSFLKKQEQDPSSVFTERRCDILVASFDMAILRSTGIEILQLLWDHGISAEMARDARSPEDLLSKHRDESYSWIVVVKPESMLKIKTMSRRDVPDVDLPLSQLMAWLRPEIKDRDARTFSKLRGSVVQVSESTGLNNIERHQEQDVKVLVAGTKSKKFNRRQVVDQAQGSAATLVRSFLDGPILAIETTDQVIDLIRETSLSDHESWKKVEHAVSMTERKYMRELHVQLDTWRSSYERKGKSKHAFIYNFRTGTCVYYDLGA
ncbi:eukaryotic translation initiation factor 2-alpha kinase [Conoideocrella luteorostrata]|uniref:non-specific serine/threonine protein kinase n=1 Tax=Conoideocrella luteorostrata TaxID=1105319 RepID=A0AAJ0CQP9_9HYPO|nr:eukaryotic translation initiation factor 2-alpha kinase [Conoideocrella luteorostrata]